MTAISSHDSPHPGPPGVHQALIKHTGFLLARMGHVAAKQFAARLEELGLTTRMWGALNVLDAEGALTQQVLGKCTGIDPSSMVSTVDDLEAAGLVERRRHPSDRRAHAIHITDHGRETLSRGRLLARSAQEELLTPLSSAERKQLHELLLRLVIATKPKAAAE
jgi:DNA-binding MarR family transcriptional regulator